MKKKLCYKIYFSLTEKRVNGTDKKIMFYYNREDKENELPIVIRWLLENDNRFEKSNEDKSFFPIWLSLHSAQQLLKGQSSSEDKEDIFCQELLLGEMQMPIIHITLSDLFVNTLFGTDSLPTDVPRYYMIMDNSIWNYLVPLSETYYIHNLIEYKNSKKNTENSVKQILFKSQDCRTNFYEAVCSICKNYKKDLYRLKVAQEYADLNARLAEQSYLSGAHASGVSPFIFHSETTAKQLVQREFRLLEEDIVYPFDKGNSYDAGSVMDLICNHKWRILLLDDKAIEPMDTKPNDPVLGKNKDGWNCKLMIIKNILCHQLGLNEHIAYGPCCDGIQKDGEPIIEEKPNNKTKILIEYAQTINEAKEALKNKKYDLILLDYLLNQTDGTHYGYELLDEIWTDQQEHKNDEENLIYSTIKPHHHLRMYCMFISAYSSAVHDRLLAEGFNQSEKYWFINLGACPTNTPQLFLYNLLKLMDKRLEDSHIRRLSINGLVDILEKIYDAESIRKSAGDYYEKIQSCQYFYRNLLQDYDIYVGDDNLFEASKSVLVTDFLNHQINMGGLLEHLAQLIHLTAFGTVRQWPEMWEEYLYAKAQMEAQIGNNADVEERFERLCNKMEGYILKLKSSAL